MLVRWARAFSGVVLWSVGAAAATADPTPAVPTVTIYAAGALKSFVALLTDEKAPLAGVDLKPTFASAGLLRSELEAGAKADLFLSADMASPRKLAAEGRAVLPPIAFARNRMCFYAPPARRDGGQPRRASDSSQSPDQDFGAHH